MRSLCSQVQHVQRLHTFADIGYDSFMTQMMVTPGIMSADEALGMTLNQYLFSAGLSASSFAPNLGLSHSSVSRKLRGRVGWSLAEILSAASFFDIEPADLMPTPDGMGGWIPAPFKPARRRDVDALVPQVGLEPTTHGYVSVFRDYSVLATLVILDVLAHLPALPLMPALPALPATPALPLLPAADVASRHFRVDENVEDHEHSPSSCLGTADASHVGGAR